jgi:hypothetical protein
MKTVGGGVIKATKPLARQRNPWPEPSESINGVPDYLGVLRTHHDDTPGQQRTKYDEGSSPEEEGETEEEPGPEDSDTRTVSTGHSVLQKAR